MEPVIFRTAHKGIYQLFLKKEVKIFAGNEIHVEPQQNAVFEKGVFQTSDEEVARIIRRSIAFMKGEIWEVTEADRRAVLGPERQKTFRGPINSSHFNEEFQGKEPEAQVPAAQKGASTISCPICQKEFVNDLGSKKFKMHMISHRPGAGKKAQEGTAIDPQ